MKELTLLQFLWNIWIESPQFCSVLSACRLYRLYQEQTIHSNPVTVCRCPVSYWHITYTCTFIPAHRIALYYVVQITTAASYPSLSRGSLATCGGRVASARRGLGCPSGGKITYLRCVSLLVYDSETRRLEAVVLIVETRKRGWCRAAPVRGRTGGRALLLRSNLRD